MTADPPRRASFAVAPSSPCVDGHFPGNPVVPGAVLLAEAASCLAAEGLAIARIRRLKFRRPVAPGETVDIEIIGGPGPALIRWSAGGEPVAEARVEIGPADA